MQLPSLKITHKVPATLESGQPTKSDQMTFPFPRTKHVKVAMLYLVCGTDIKYYAPHMYDFHARQYVCLVSVWLVVAAGDAPDKVVI